MFTASADKRRDCDRVAVDFEEGKRDFDRFGTDVSLKGAHHSSMVGSETARATGGGRLGRPRPTWRGFDAIIRNAFREDHLALEAWRLACRLPRNSNKNKDESETTGNVNAESSTKMAG